MAQGAPDWIRRIEVMITAGQPAKERAAGDAGSYTGTDTTYQTVASWTVATGYVGELKEILVLSSSYAKTQVKITIGDITWCTDWAPQSAMPIIFEDLRLEAAKIIKVEAKSSDTTSITVDAIITAKEAIL